MKTVLLVMCGLVCAMNAMSQRGYIMWPTDSKSEKILFTESVYNPEANITTLYANAKKFAADNIKGEKDTIIVNEINKTLTCRGSIYLPVEELGERGYGYIGFTLMIWCRQNSYKYNFTDFEHHGLNADCVNGGPLENDKTASGPVLFPSRYWNAQKAKCYYRIQNTIEKLKHAMAEQAES